MPEYAATSCQRKCDVIRGSVYDVCELLVDGQEAGSVVTSDNRGNITSRPLTDLGTEDSNNAYLEAIRSCPGPGKGGLFGLGKLPCQAVVDGQNLGECMVTIRRG